MEGQFKALQDRVEILEGYFEAMMTEEKAS
jgi:hypothetical protein